MIEYDLVSCIRCNKPAQMYHEPQMYHEMYHASLCQARLLLLRLTLIFFYRPTVLYAGLSHSLFTQGRQRHGHGGPGFIYYF